MLTSRLQTRNRAVDWKAPAPAAEDPALLRANLAPTELLPVDGIVRKTALEATRGARTDVDKARAKTRGCGTGDIKAMLETGNLGGKCADLNAIFVGMCRAVGVPARDVYGLRMVPSAFGRGFRTVIARASSWYSAPGTRARTASQASALARVTSRGASRVAIRAEISAIWAGVFPSPSTTSGKPWRTARW